MSNNRGAVLILTLSFFLIFTMLGFGAVYLAGVNNQVAEERSASLEAFWLADAGVERAKTGLPLKLYADGQHDNLQLGNGTYDLASANDVIKDNNGNVTYTFKYRWVVDSAGTVNGESRHIQAVISALDNRFSIITRGTVKDMDSCPMSSVTIECELVKENTSFSLDTYFKGLSKADIFNMAAQTYTDPNNSGDVDPIEEITVINLVNNNSINLTTDNITSDSVFLIVDTTAASGNPNNPPQLKITGNGAFEGVIWIIGEAEITGTPSIKGTIFVEGDPGQETKLAGNSVILFNAENVDKAVGWLGATPNFLPGDPEIIDWKEL